MRVCFLLLDCFCNTNSGWISAACDSTVNLKAVCNIYVVIDMLRCLFCKSARRIWPRCVAVLPYSAGGVLQNDGQVGRNTMNTEPRLISNLIFL